MSRWLQFPLTLRNLESCAGFDGRNEVEVSAGTPRGEKERGSVRTASPVKEDRLDQRDHVSAGVVTGTNACYMDELQRHESRGHHELHHSF